MNYRYIFLCLIILPVFNLNNSKAQIKKVMSDGNAKYLSNTLIVKLKNKPAGDILSKASLPVSLQKALKTIDAVSAQYLFKNSNQSLSSNLNDIILIEYSANIDPLLYAEKLRKNPEIEWAEPKFIYPVTLVPDDPLYENQYNLNIINASSAWDISTGDTSIVIGIIDTGVDWQHPDLNANIWINHDEIPNNGIDDDNNGFTDDYRGWDFGGFNGTPDNNPAEDQPDHGTHVAGIASAVSDNNTGIASIGFNSKIMAVKTSQNDFRNDDNVPYVVYGYEGIVYAADNGAKIINCSWGGSGFSLLGQSVVFYALSRGSLIVAAAGNENSHEPHYPSSYFGVISVASTASNDTKSAFSNYGEGVDVSAPGSSILSTWQDDDEPFKVIQGTSMASPLAAGLAALIAARFPDFTPLQIGEQLRVNSDDIYDINTAFTYRLGKGRINAFNCLNNINSKSVRTDSLLFFDDQPGGNADGILRSGETISLEIFFTNYLSAVNNLQISLETLNDLSTVDNNLYNAGLLNTLETSSNSSSVFTIVLDDNIPDNQELFFLLRYEDINYSDFQLIKVIVNPTYATHAGNNVALTITNTGNLGFNDYPGNEQGDGFTFLDGDNLLFEGALILGTGPERISDAARSSNQDIQSSDFQSTEPFVLRIPGIRADVEGLTAFNDESAGVNKLGLNINLTSYTFALPPDDNYIILKYRLINHSGSNLENLHAGLFLDWDLGDAADNVTGYNIDNHFGYVYSSTRNPDVYTASALVSGNRYNFRAIQNDGMNENFGIYDGFTDAEKWNSIAGRISVVSAGPQDVSHIVAGGPYNLPAGDTIFVAFALAAGENLEKTGQSIIAARNMYRENLAEGEIIEDEIPSDFEISQNFPNPFNTSTNIEYFIPIVPEMASVPVTIKVFDILGNEVAVLINEQKNPGIYTINFNAENLPGGQSLASGVYIFRINAGEFSESKKMMLIK